MSKGIGESQTKASVVSNSVPSSYSPPRTPISCPACSPENQCAATAAEIVNSTKQSTTNQIRQTQGGTDPRSAHVVKSRGEGPGAGDGAPRGGGEVACGSDLEGRFSAEEIRRLVGEMVGKGLGREEKD